MRLLSNPWIPILATSSLAIGACNAEVTRYVERPADDTPSTTASDDLSPLDPDDHCANACALYLGCAQVDDCVARCKAASGVCEDMRKYVDLCLAHQTSAVSCNLEEGCGATLSNWVECAKVSLDGECGGDPLGCGCDLHDQHGNEYGVACETGTDEDGNALDVSHCECTLNGVAVGLCSTEVSRACTVPTDCCSGIFFIAGVPTP